MRTVNLKILATLILGSTIFIGYIKESEPNLNSTSPADNDATVITEQSGLLTKLTIRPGLKDGQDTYVSKLVHYLAGDGNTNLDYVHEIVIGKRYLSQYNDSAREQSYIRFDSLAKIPSGATIVSAKLYLYGESSSLSGNSYCPGSSNPENSCVVKRVTEANWQETTLTWNNKPGTTDLDDAIIPASSRQFNYNATVDVTKMVAAIVSSGINYGFNIQVVVNRAPRAMEFSTSEAANKTLRPKLVVQYQ